MHFTALTALSILSGAMALPQTCNPGACLSALTSSGVSCAEAVAEHGLDAVSDAACITSAKNIGQCKGCPGSSLIQKRDCDTGACLFALSSAGFECSAAALEEGFNPIADAGCLGAAASIPVCKGCPGITTIA